MREEGREPEGLSYIPFIERLLNLAMKCVSYVGWFFSSDTPSISIKCVCFNNIYYPIGYGSFVCIHYTMYILHMYIILYALKVVGIPKKKHHETVFECASPNNEQHTTTNNLPYIHLNIFSDSVRIRIYIYIYHLPGQGQWAPWNDEVVVLIACKLASMHSIKASEPNEEKKFIIIKLRESTAVGSTNIFSKFTAYWKEDIFEESEHYSIGQLYTAEIVFSCLYRLFLRSI